MLRQNCLVRDTVLSWCRSSRVSERSLTLVDSQIRPLRKTYLYQVVLLARTYQLMREHDTLLLLLWCLNRRDGARHRSPDRHGHRGPGSSSRDVPQGTRLCSLAGSGATAALDGWQAAARSHDEDGGAISTAASDHRRQQRHHQAACPCRGPAGHMAGRDADTQTTNVGAGGAGEQDGTDRLGPDGPGRRLPVSGRGGMSPL